MIKSSLYKILLLPLLLLGVMACETEFANPNAPTDEQILSSREGLIALGVGIQNTYSTSGLRWLYETPAVTTREVGITTTFQNMIDLEDGGDALPNFNGNTSGIWSTMLRVNSMCTDMINALGNVDLTDDERNSLQAMAHLYKAMAIGMTALSFEQVISTPSTDNMAAFVSRQRAFEEAVDLLAAADGLVGGGNVAPVVQNTILGGVDLPNSILAMQARFELFAGNEGDAAATAAKVDLGATSLFNYDAQNRNPMWSRVFLDNAPNWKPRDNFGIPTDVYTFDPADGRIAFYTVPLDETNQNGLPIEDLAGFYVGAEDPIPVYLPGEMLLIQAEVAARDNRLGDAIGFIDQVRTDMDVYGVDANIGPYMGPETQEDVLLEIYANRRAELLLNGLSLEDSRRFNRPEPNPMPMTFDDERNRNFYPYPERERNNNPNTPADPAL